MKILFTIFLLFSFCLPAVAGQLSSRTAGLLDLWHFNGGATLIDNVGGNTGTITGMAYTSTGKLGQEGSFDGNDFVGISAITQILSTNNFTLLCWIKTISNGVNEVYYVNTTIYGERAAGFTRAWGQINGYISLSGYDCSFTGGGTGSNADKFLGTVRIDDNKWHQCVWTGTSAGVIKLYVDGVLDVSGTWGAIITGDTNPRIGRDADDAKNYYWVGKIDETAVFNRALSAAEIKAIYNDQQYGRKKTDEN